MGGDFRLPQLWSLTDGRIICEFPVESPNAAFSADGGLLMLVPSHSRTDSGSSDISLWDVHSGREVRRLKRPLPWLNRMAISPTGKAVAASFSSDGGNSLEIHVWETEHGKELTVVKSLPQKTYVRALAVTPDSKVLIVACSDNKVRAWDISSGQELQPFEDLVGPITSPLVFSPDGRSLAAGTWPRRGDEAGIYLWEVASGRIRSEWAGHHGGVTALAFSPDGRRLASGSQDTTVLQWELTGRK